MTERGRVLLTVVGLLLLAGGVALVLHASTLRAQQREPMTRATACATLARLARSQGEQAAVAAWGWLAECNERRSDAEYYPGIPIPDRVPRCWPDGKGGWECAPEILCGAGERFRVGEDGRTRCVAQEESDE